MSESVTVIGPGAIGCSIAAALFDGGLKPIIYGRTPFDELVVDQQKKGTSTEHRYDVTVETDPAKLEPTDYVFLATKANQIPSVAEALAAATTNGSSLLVAQNGLLHAERVAPYIGDSVDVFPTVVMLPADRTAPGTVTVRGAAALTVPDAPSTRELAKTFDQSFMRLDTTDDFVTASWIKLMLNAGFGAIGVLTRKPNTVLEDPEAYDITFRIMSELLPVARAEGADIDDDAPARYLDIAARGSSGHPSSILVDRLHDRPTEWRERNAVIGELGRKHGIETPLNDLITSLIRLGEPDAE